MQHSFVVKEAEGVCREHGANHAVWCSKLELEVKDADGNSVKAQDDMTLVPHNAKLTTGNTKVRQDDTGCINLCGIFQVSLCMSLSGP